MCLGLAGKLGSRVDPLIYIGPVILNTGDQMARKRNLYNPDSDEPYRLSRTKLENFLKCPRCFYLDRRLGVGQPPGFPFNINSAVDELLKREFDQCRANQVAHPYMVEAAIDAVPAIHPELDNWRKNFVGVSHVHAESNFEVFGAIDDLWLGSDGQYIVVDYKATSKSGEVTLDADWQISYKRQMEIYQWLLRKNGLPVSERGWFVYCNGKRDADSFKNKVEFAVKLLPYDGSDDWVDNVLLDARDTLTNAHLPPSTEACDYCAYRKDASTFEN